MADDAAVKIRRRVPRRLAAASTAVLTLAIIGAIAAGAQPGGAGSDPAAEEASARPAVTAAPTAAPLSSVSARSVTDFLPRASVPQRLVVGSAGIDLEVLPLTPSAEELAEQSIVPPETLDAYWLSSYGRPGRGSDNTTYITGHSWDDRDAPFNRLSTDVKVGDPVAVTTAAGTMEYVVDSVATHNKQTLKDSDIWQAMPNRLVLVSCYSEDLWGKNVIVTATPVR